MTKTKFCQGISDISDSYNAMLIDQWGVLHNGEKVYDGTIDCLRELKNRNKYIIILSNSGKRSDHSRERLKKFGILPSLYDEIVTSGEMCAAGLTSQDDGFFNDIGKSCYLICRSGDDSVVENTGVSLVDDVDEADFLLISGSDMPHKTMADHYEPILRKAIRKRLKAICANPDSRALLGDNYIHGPGLIARRYEDFGGVVHYIGKPHQPIFRHCIKLLQERNIYPGETVMIGDTMAHDIWGAASVDIDTCLVKSGMHHGAFRNCKNPAEVNRALNILSVQYNNIRPTYLVDKLKWGNALPDRKHKKRKVAVIA